MRAASIEALSSVNGDLSIVLKVPKQYRAEALAAVDEANQIAVNGKELAVDISAYRQKRSLSANAYCWVLCEKLAEKVGITKEDVYREQIRRVGVFKDFPPMGESHASTLEKAWAALGTGWITERVDWDKDGEYIIVRCYYGSSRYNTKQMSRLLDNLVSDCKEQGIETATPAELELLKSEWGRK